VWFSTSGALKKRECAHVNEPPSPPSEIHSRGFPREPRAKLFAPPHPPRETFFSILLSSKRERSGSRESESTSRERLAGPWTGSLSFAHPRVHLPFKQLPIARLSLIASETTSQSGCNYTRIACIVARLFAESEVIKSPYL